MFSQKDGITQTESETDDTCALLISCVKISCVKASTARSMCLKIFSKCHSSVQYDGNVTQTLAHKCSWHDIQKQVGITRTPTKMQAYTHYTQVRSAKTKPCASANAHIHQQRIQTMKWTIVQASKRHNVETNTVSDLLIELSHI